MGSTTPRARTARTPPIPKARHSRRASGNAGTHSMRKHTLVHPGEILLLDFLEPMGISAYKLSKDTGVSQQQYGRIIKGVRSISADVALRLARYFGTSAQLWMGLQSQYDLDVADDAKGKAIQKRVQPLRAA